MEFTYKNKNEKKIKQRKITKNNKTNFDDIYIQQKGDMMLYVRIN